MCSRSRRYRSSGPNADARVVECSPSAPTGGSARSLVPAPVSRRDHFRIRPGTWATLMTGQNSMLGVMRQAAEDGIRAAGAHTVAGERLAEMRDFYAYLAAELPALVDRWRERYHGAATR